jgi:hypothetical protein
MPGGIGDPQIEGVDGVGFEFSGVPHRLHKLYGRGEAIRVLGRLTPVGWTPEGGDPEDADRQYFSWIHVVLGDVQVIVGEDGTTHVITPTDHVRVESKVDTIDAPGHPGSTRDGPHPLQGVPHLNVRTVRMPPYRVGESGIWVDGPTAAKNPEAYLVPEPGPPPPPPR